MAFCIPKSDLPFALCFSIEIYIKHLVIGYTDLHDKPMCFIILPLEVMEMFQNKQYHVAHQSHFTSGGARIKSCN